MTRTRSAEDDVTPATRAAMDRALRKAAKCAGHNGTATRRASTEKRVQTGCDDQRLFWCGQTAWRRAHPDTRNSVTATSVLVPRQRPACLTRPTAARSRSSACARLSRSAALGEESTLRRYIGGSTPRGTQMASQAAPASQKGHTGSFTAGGATPASAAMSAISSLRVVTSPPARM